MVRHLGLDDCGDLAETFRRSYHDNYLAMYSSVLGGVVTHPFLMVIPLDDHMVHRGDGIFEVFKCVAGSLYNLQGHLERLANSARAVHLNLPGTLEEISRLAVETVRVTGSRDCLVRLFVSRGPGGFTTNPYECPKSQLYIMVCRLNPRPIEHHENGVTLKGSSVPIKTSYFANIKSCNYLPNVLMKKEAVDAGVDFTVSIDEHGFLGEGSTENIGVVTAQRLLKFPTFSRILRGTTVLRAARLAESLVEQGTLAGVVFEEIPATEAYSSAEILLFGTTFDILPAVSFDNHPIGSGRPGPVYRALRERLERDIRTNSALRTPVFSEHGERQEEQGG
jgi:branched-chain amino acid aminotransferase